MSKKCDRCGMRFEILNYSEQVEFKSALVRQVSQGKQVCNDCLDLFQLLDTKEMIIKEFNKERRVYRLFLKNIEQQINKINKRQKKYFKLKE